MLAPDFCQPLAVAVSDLIKDIEKVVLAARIRFDARSLFELIEAVAKHFVQQLRAGVVHTLREHRQHRTCSSHCNDPNIAAFHLFPFR